MSRRYVILDVFTDRPLAGNPLAVVLDSEGLDTDSMQAIAREFNMSETVFVAEPESPRHRARMRIFTPARELPFAGHPTVGAAVLLGLEEDAAQGGGAGGADAQAFGLEQRIGVVSCVVETVGEGRGRARFKVPRTPEYLGPAPDSARLAWALGLQPDDIGFARHVPSRHSAGVAFDFVPVGSLEALAKAWPGVGFPEVFEGDHPAAYVYAALTAGDGQRFRARMFAPGLGVAEDPATGSAAAAFAGMLMQSEPLGDGVHDFVIEQGFDMGRPSLIDLQLSIDGGALSSVEIGGGAVVVARGELLL
ncbi:MAG: PhzF family phenazine biosynthesis protein [Salinarimonadaceae bacterium]|nr:MAG: PhzF family phenazine biosynthesis protein [Salinarimonadaceae bacterium]